MRQKSLHLNMSLSRQLNQNKCRKKCIFPNDDLGHKFTLVNGASHFKIYPFLVFILKTKKKAEFQVNHCVHLNQ